MKYKNLNTGNYRQRFAIYRTTTSRDAATNQAIETPSLLYTRWASIEGITGDNTDVDARQLIGECTHMIRLRYIEGLLVTDYGTFNGRRFDFRVVINVEERNWETVIYAVELVPTNT